MEPSRSQFGVYRCTWSTFIQLTFVLIGCALAGSQTIAQEPNKETASQASLIEGKQKQLVQRFQKLEELFLRMSELEAVSNPSHAALLMQAAQLSKQLGTRQRLYTASELIAKGQLSKAIQEQESAHDTLKKLLDLLQSENRANRIRDERVKLEDVLKEIRRIESIQRSLRGRTESGQDLEQSSKDQTDLNQQIESVESSLKTNPNESKEDTPKGTEKGNDSLENSPNPSNPPSEPSPSGETESSSSEKSPPKGSESTAESESEKGVDGKDANDSEKNGDGKNEEKGKESENPPGREPGKESDPKSSNEEESPTDSPDKPAEKSKPNNSPSEKGEEGSSSESSGESSESSGEQSGESSSGNDKPKTKEEKAQERVQRARKRMQKAAENLQQNQREEGVQEQRAAEKELRDAAEELERILRQLREEEIERALVDLETRLKRMNEQQKSVRAETEKLNSLSGTARERNLEIQSNKLSIEQNKIVLEGQRALLLLQDEGSSTAFPEAMEQILVDAQQVAKRLTAGNVAESTQLLQDEVIASLEELLESLKQVQKSREEEKKQRQQPGGPQPPQTEQDQPLVDRLAELRLLKTLQLRINRRTQSLAQQLDLNEDALGQVKNPDLQSDMEDLAGRQLKIYEVTREILFKTSQN